MSEPHTSTFNVKFCLYGTYDGMYIAASTAGSVSHLYRAPLLSPCAPPVLPSFIGHPAMGPHLRDADRGRGKGRSLRLGMKDPPHCVTYVMLPRSLSSHNVLQSPSYCVITTQFSFKNTRLNIL